MAVNLTATGTRGGGGTAAPAPGGGSGAVRFAGGKSDGTTSPRIAFVSTNSITQGEQVAQLWPLLFDRYGLEISFAHRTFEWGSDARGKAHVHVVIIGLDRKVNAPDQRRLFSYAKISGDPVETSHKAISPYLFDAGALKDPHTVVKEVNRPLNGMNQLISGSQPIDGGHYIFDAQEREAFLAIEPNADLFLRPFVGAVELISGSKRWILALQDASANELSKLPKVRDRMRW